jgi:DNA primase
LARFDPDFLQRVRESTNILDVVGGYVSLQKKGKRYWACCPFHQEKTPSFSVSPEDGLYYCFGCHAGGDVFSFLEKMENLSFPEAVERLAEAAHIELPAVEMTPEEKFKRKERETLYKVAAMALDYFHNCLTKTRMGKAGLAYFEKRHLSMADIEKFHLGFAPPEWQRLIQDFYTRKHISPDILVRAGLAGQKNGRYYDMFRNRCMFPIFDSKGRPVAFGGRIMDDSRPKYLNSPETPIFNKRRLLFGFYQALPEIRKKRQVIMVEGYMDAISLHTHGVTNAVASLGTAFTVEQARLMKRYADEVVFSYDMDAAGQNATRRALEIAGNMGLKLRVVHLADGKDPDEFVNHYGGEAYLEAVSRAKPAMDYLLESLLKQNDRFSLEGQHRILDDMFAVLTARGDSFLFNSYIRKMARLLRMEEGMIRSEASRYARKHNSPVYISQGTEPAADDKSDNGEAEKQRMLERGLIRYCFHTGRIPKGWEHLADYTFVDPFCSRMFAILSRLAADGKPWSREEAEPDMSREDVEALAPLLVKEETASVEPWEEFIRPALILELQREYRKHTEKADAFSLENNREEAAKEMKICMDIHRKIRKLRMS